MDSKEPNGMKFAVGDRRIFQGQAYEIVDRRIGHMGVYILAKFPKRKVPGMCPYRLPINRILFESTSTELTGMVGAIFGD